MYVEWFLNSPREKKCVKEFTEGEDVFEQTSQDLGDTSIVYGESELVSLYPSLTEQLAILATAKQILRERSSTPYTKLRAIAVVQSSTRSDMRNNSQQTGIKEYLRK